MNEAGTGVGGMDGYDGIVDPGGQDGGERSAARRPQIGSRAMALAGFASLTLDDGNPPWTWTVTFARP